MRVCVYLHVHPVKLLADRMNGKLSRTSASNSLPSIDEWKEFFNTINSTWNAGEKSKSAD